MLGRVRDPIPVRVQRLGSVQHGEVPAQHLREVARRIGGQDPVCQPADLGGIASQPRQLDEMLDRLRDEPGLSRLYAGIHYGFDMDAGLVLGRAVAAKALSADLQEVAVP